MRTRTSPGARSSSWSTSPTPVSITDTLPDAWPSGGVATLADEVVDALAAVHRVPWDEVGLDGFGRPDGFLERQVRRWHGQWELRSRAARCRAWTTSPPGWSTGARRRSGPASCTATSTSTTACSPVPRPRLLAVIDWEMATIGDPLLDLGLLLRVLGPAPGGEPRDARPAGGLPRARCAARSSTWWRATRPRSATRSATWRTTGCSRCSSSPRSSRPPGPQHLAGDLDTPYAAALEHDVPTLLEEAWALTGT